MAHVWAKSELKWEGFEPHSYFLDNEKVWNLSLKKIPSGENTTVGEVIAAFREQKVVIEDHTIEVVVKSESQKFAVRGPHVHLKILELLYWFADRNVSPFDVQWFYFGSATCLKDPQESYDFFLVAGNQIINESYRLSDWPDNGFDPSFLLTSKDDDPVWSDSEQWREADKNSGTASSIGRLAPVNYWCCGPMNRPSITILTGDRRLPMIPPEY